MNNLDHLTLANLQWIKHNAFPIMGTGITPDKLDTLVRARALILNVPTPIIDCFSCSARAEAQVSNSILDQYKQAILDKITKLETVEFSQTFYVMDQGSEDEEVITLPTQELTNSVSDDVIVEKIVSIESTENEINVKTVKAKK
jgi:hypothetical protein